MNRTVLGFRLIMTFFAFLIIGLILDFPLLEMPIKFPVKEAQAVVGRPGTPASVGGVRRRTRRRTRRRWAIGTRMYTMPAGYTTTVVHQTTYYVVDGEYFKKAYEGDKVVYVVVEDPKETSTDKADAQAQPAQAEPAQAQPAQTQPASTGTAEQKLLDLKNLYDKGLIDKEEYEAKKKEILDSM
jgi:hypothetical protein